MMDAVPIKLKKPWLLKIKTKNEDCRTNVLSWASFMWGSNQRGLTHFVGIRVGETCWVLFFCTY